MRCLRGFALAAVALGGLPAGLGAKPLPNPKPQYKALCTVDDAGRAHCLRVSDLNRLLTPDQVQKLQQLLDDLFPELAGRKGSAANTLADCGHDYWTRANLTIPPAPSGLAPGIPGSTRKAPAFPSTAQAEQLVSRCRSVVQSDFDHQVETAGGGASRFVSDTVSRMDAAVAQCRDQTSPVAAQTGASQYVDARDRYNQAVQGVTNKYSATDVANDAPGARAAYGALYDAEALKKLLDDFFHEAQSNTDRTDREQTMSLLAAVMDGITETLEKIVNPPPASNPPPPPAPAPGPGPAPSAPAPPTPAVTMPCMGEDCKPTCGQIAAAWNMFKTYCDQSKWKAYQCVAFLAKANGCADPRLIHPSPEGEDMPCTSKAKVDKWTKAKAAWLDQCRKRQWVMMPTQDGKLTCVAPDFGAMPPAWDPCHDPRAMPGPDDCTGPSPKNPIEPPKPVPQPDPRRPGE